MPLQFTKFLNILHEFVWGTPKMNFCATKVKASLISFNKKSSCLSNILEFEKILAPGIRSPRSNKICNNENTQEYKNCLSADSKFGPGLQNSKF